MASSEVEICNLALTAISAATISDLEDDSHEAELCKLHYPQVRDWVIRRYRWACAKVTLDLNQDVEPPDDMTFAYQYTIPSDPFCLRVLGVPGSTLRDYKVVNNRKVWSNREEVKVEYLVRITDPNQMDTSLVDAIAFQIAFRICLSLTNDKQLKEQMRLDFKEAIATARKANAIEAFEKRPPNTDWIDAGRSAG